MKYEQHFNEKHVVELLMRNIDGHMAPYIAMTTINTFQELLDRVTKFERLPKPRSFGFNYQNNLPAKEKHNKIFDPKWSEVNTTFSSDKKEKGDSINPLKMIN